MNRRAMKLHRLKGLLFTLTEAHDWIREHAELESIPNPLVLDRLENEIGRLRVKIRRLEERV